MKWHFERGKKKKGDKRLVFKEIYPGTRYFFLASELFLLVNEEI